MFNDENINLNLSIVKFLKNKNSHKKYKIIEAKNNFINLLLDKAKK